MVCNKINEEEFLCANCIRTVVIFATTVAGIPSNPALQEVFRWNQMDFELPSETTFQEELPSGEFVQENNLPLGLEVWQDKIFVTVPRWKPGVLSTLNYINLNDKSKSPKLQPYPDWAYNRIYGGDGIKIVSVFRVRADECDRLWVLDTGQDDRLGKKKQIKTPKILIFDLHTDQLLHIYNLNEDLTNKDSLFANIIVDVSADYCDQAFAYVLDLKGYAVIVYNLKTNSAFRVKHNYFHIDPLAGNYYVAGLNYQWRDGIFSMALSPARGNTSRTIYFHSLSSNMEFVVDSNTLQNETSAKNHYAYKILGFKGEDCQSASSFLDPLSGVLFYSLANKNGVGCWNSFGHHDDFSPRTNILVASDKDTMSFISDLKVDRNGVLWLMSNRLPEFMYGQLNPEEVNYRILSGKVEDVVKNTVCKPIN